VRDYIHVTDLASAHLLALDALSGGDIRWNLGNGAGYSVLEVLQAIERVAGRKVPHMLAERRAGDAASLVASAEPALRAGWEPRHAGLDDIVRTALAWRAAHPNGYGN